MSYRAIPICATWLEYERVMSHIWMRRHTRMNGSRHTHTTVISRHSYRTCVRDMTWTWMSHVTQMNASSHTYEWITSHTYECHFAPFLSHLREIVEGRRHEAESGHSYEWVMSHMNRSWKTHEWVMSHIWKGRVVLRVLHLSRIVEGRRIEAEAERIAIKEESV